MTDYRRRTSTYMKLLIVLFALGLAACREAAVEPEDASLPETTAAGTCSVPEDPAEPSCEVGSAEVTDSPVLPATQAVEPASASPRDAPLPTPTSLAEGHFGGASADNTTADCPEAIPWFFENPATECAAVVLNTWAVMQSFEGGLMLWTQEGGLTYVFVDDGSPFKPYAILVDTVGVPLPESDPAIVPPPDRTQPVLGLAKFWRGLVPGSEWVRDSLGWATASEIGYSALWQCNTAEGPESRCYFTGPRDEIVAITQGETRYWSLVQGPVRRDIVR